MRLSAAYYLLALSNSSLKSENILPMRPSCIPKPLAALFAVACVDDLLADLAAGLLAVALSKAAFSAADLSVAACSSADGFSRRTSSAAMEAGRSESSSASGSVASSIARFALASVLPRANAPFSVASATAFPALAVASEAFAAAAAYPSPAFAARPPVSWASAA